MCHFKELSEKEIASQKDVYDCLHTHDTLKRHHHQLRSQHYWETLVDVTDKEARRRYDIFLDQDLEINLISSKIDQAVISNAKATSADQGDLKNIINKLKSALPFKSPEYLRSRYQEIAITSRYHSLKKGDSDSKIELLNLYSTIVEHRRKQAELSGFPNYRSVCEKIDGREALPDLLSVIPSDFYLRLNDFSKIPSIREPQIHIDPLKEIHYLFSNIPILSKIFFDIINTSAFDIVPRTNKANIRGLMIFRPYERKASILSNNLSGVGQYDLVAHELAHACHWTLAASQPHFEFSEPQPDFAEIIAVFFEFLAADLINDKGQTLQWKIYSRLESIFWSTRLFEFEAAIYNEARADIASTWKEISQKYSLEQTGYLSHLENYWMLFTQPFYYSRYALATIVGWKLYCRYKNHGDTINVIIQLMASGSLNPLSAILNELKIKINHLAVNQTIDQMFLALKT
jgi:oligoendopeptidase F